MKFVVFYYLGSILAFLDPYPVWSRMHKQYNTAIALEVWSNAYTDNLWVKTITIIKCNQVVLTILLYDYYACCLLLKVNGETKTCGFQTFRYYPSPIWLLCCLSLFRRSLKVVRIVWESQVDMTWPLYRYLCLVSIKYRSKFDPYQRLFRIWLVYSLWHLDGFGFILFGLIFRGLKPNPDWT